MATPSTESSRRHRGNPAFGRSPLVDFEEGAVETGALLRDLVTLEAEERLAQRELRRAEDASATLRQANEGAERESERHLAELVQALRDLHVDLARGITTSEAGSRVYRLLREAEKLVEVESRGRQLRRSVERREDESREYRRQLDDLTHQEIALGRAAIEQLRDLTRSIVIDARGARVSAGRDIRIGG